MWAAVSWWERCVKSQKTAAEETTRVVELWVWLGRDPANEYSKQVERKLANHESPASHAVGIPQVHGFCDGGEKACNAVTFLRWELMNEWKLQVRSCPDQILCYPAEKEMELMGCLTLTRMYDTCWTSLQFANTHECKRIFWVDSSTVLSWIKTPSQKFEPFVLPRVPEIQESVWADDFRYIRSKINSAGTLTRGTALSRITDWQEGPSFLPKSNGPVFELKSKVFTQKKLKY